jgi:hypothetical protein
MNTIIYNFFFKNIRYSQSVRNFFQNQYDSVVIAFDGNDFKLDIWATFIVSVTLYWSVGLSLLFLDLTKWPKFLYKYKIQDTESVSFVLKNLIKKHLNSNKD